MRRADDVMLHVRALTHAQRPVCAGAGMPCCHTKCGSQLHGTDAMLMSPLAWGVAMTDVRRVRRTRRRSSKVSIVRRTVSARMSHQCFKLFLLVCQDDTGSVE